jgi:Aldo/keto reductase family
MPLLSTPTGKPRVILGLMTFGPPGTENKGARITDIDEYNKCLDYFQKEGYNEVDTARVYIEGDQEAFTKQAHWQERGLKLATKHLPVTPGEHKKEILKRTLNKSLQELGADCVDIFYLHTPDRSVPYEETLEACNEVFKEGKFVQLGLSNYAAWEVAEFWNIANERGWVKPTIYQGEPLIHIYLVIWRLIHYSNVQRPDPGCGKRVNSLPSEVQHRPRHLQPCTSRPISHFHAHFHSNLPLSLPAVSSQGSIKLLKSPNQVDTQPPTKAKAGCIAIVTSKTAPSTL